MKRGRFISIQFMSTYWIMFLKPNTVTLFHLDGYQRKKKYSTLCSGLCTWTKRKIFRSATQYKAVHIKCEPNFLDDSTVNNRVLTVFELKRCFSHSCVKCYCGNDQTPLAGRGHLCGHCVMQDNKGWTAWREETLMLALCECRNGLLGQSLVGACAVLSQEQMLPIPGGALLGSRT